VIYARAIHKLRKKRAEMRKLRELAEAREKGVY